MNRHRLFQGSLASIDQHSTSQFAIGLALPIDLDFFATIAAQPP